MHIDNTIEFIYNNATSFKKGNFFIIIIFI